MAMAFIHARSDVTGLFFLVCAFPEPHSCVEWVLPHTLQLCYTTTTGDHLCLHLDHHGDRAERGSPSGENRTTAVPCEAV